MSDLISRGKLRGVIEPMIGIWYDEQFWIDYKRVLEIIETMPSAEPEMITIEEVSNQLGCATLQSAFYWFEFLKTLDLLGFAIVKKETK